MIGSDERSCIGCNSIFACIRNVFEIDHSWVIGGYKSLFLWLQYESEAALSRTLDIYKIFPLNIVHS